MARLVLRPLTAVLRAALRATEALSAPAPRFAHGAKYRFSWGVTLIGSYHPSQQNTFTRKLTRPMFHAVFKRASALLKGDSGVAG